MPGTQVKNASNTFNEMSEVLGFSDPTNFSRLFRRRVGFSPKAFREQLKADQDASEAN